MGVVQTLPLEGDEQDLQQSVQEIRELLDEESTPTPASDFSLLSL